MARQVGEACHLGGDFKDHGFPRPRGGPHEDKGAVAPAWPAAQRGFAAQRDMTRGTRSWWYWCVGQVKTRGGVRRRR